jgi:DNA modification methylase
MQDNNDYYEFLQSKICLSQNSGFKIDRNTINTMLFEFQKDIVKWAIEGGRRAIFASFGLGKTFMQLEILKAILNQTQKRVLLITPLGVRQEFKTDAKKLGIELNFIRSSDEVSESGFYITNYESVRDGKLDVNLFVGTSLDEASCLRSFGSKTYQSFLELFRDVKYKFVGTATPAPNEFKEIIHYAGYLGVMDTGQALTRFFKRDSQKAGHLTLHPHMEKEFWMWVSSWAIFINKPSDLGYSDDGYNLPVLHIHEHVIKTDVRIFSDKDGQLNMMPNANLGLKEAAKEKRDSIDLRVAEMVNIVNSKPEEHFILWHDQESEREAIKKAIPEAIEVYGSQDLEIREQNIIDFSNGITKYLATKPILSGSGCNFQRHCSNSIFVGIGFKFNDFIQAVHRIYRFLQTKECHIHLIYTDTEIEVYKTLMRKWAQHKEMVEQMTNIIKKYGLSHSEMANELKRSLGVKRVESRGERYIAINNDCVIETRNMESNSIDLIHTSIPFSNHYEYTPTYEDFGHNQNNDRFFQQMDYLTPELLRVLKPGRVAAIHVKDRVLFGNVTGYGMPSMDPFHCTCIEHYRKHGFIYFGMITVVTDVVRENNQTYRLGWTEQCKDGSKMGVGCPEYVLLFRKLPSDTSKAYADEKVQKDKVEYTRARWQVDAHGFWRSSGNRLLNPSEMASYPPEVLSKVFTQYTLENIYNYEHHVKVGEELDLKGCLPSSFMALAPGSWHPDVWHDVRRMITLNSEQSQRNLNQHICPLQFDIVDRIITRYSNKNDLVYDPFGGLGTVPYRAIKLGRRGMCCELNPVSFTDSLSYLRAADQEYGMPSLFDFENINVA